MSLGVTCPALEMEAAVRPPPEEESGRHAAAGSRIRQRWGFRFYHGWDEWEWSPSEIRPEDSTSRRRTAAGNGDAGSVRDGVVRLKKRRLCRRERRKQGRHGQDLFSGVKTGGVLR